MSYEIEISIKDGTDFAPGRAIILVTKHPREEISDLQATLGEALLEISTVHTAEVHPARTGITVEVAFDGDWTVDIRIPILDAILKTLGEDLGATANVTERSWHSNKLWATFTHTYKNPDSGWV